MRDRRRRGPGAQGVRAAPPGYVPAALVGRVPLPVALACGMAEHAGGRVEVSDWGTVLVVNVRGLGGPGTYRRHARAALRAAGLSRTGETWYLEPR